MQRKHTDFKADVVKNHAKALRWSNRNVVLNIVGNWDLQSKTNNTVLMMLF